MEAKTSTGELNEKENGQRRVGGIAYREIGLYGAA